VRRHVPDTLSTWRRTGPVDTFLHDEGMTTTVCAFCAKHAHMTPRWANLVSESRPGFGPRTILQAAATCDNCGHASIALSDNFINTGNNNPSDYFNYTSDDAFIWHPRTGAAPEFPDVPEHIARAAKEAHAAESINSFMSAILMARTVVEAAAKEKGITQGFLVAKIDEMAKQGLIRSATKHAADEIRLFGNDMAHGDIEDFPDAEDVRDVLILMDEILTEVFQGPARTERLRRNRTSAKE
jgi:hypothetical protein